MFDVLVSLRKYFEVYADMPELDERRDRVVVDGQFTQAAEVREVIISPWVMFDRFVLNSFVDDMQVSFGGNLSPPRKNVLKFEKLLVQKFVIYQN